MQMMVLGIHRDLKSGRRFDRLAADSLANGVNVRGASLFNRLSPHLYSYISGFHRIIGDPFVSARKFVLFHVRFPILNESLIF